MNKLKPSRKVKDSDESKPATNLWFDIESHQWPIIYRQEYNVHFIGLEKLHPFDACKWANIYQYLKEEGIIDDNTVTRPQAATRNDLLFVHTVAYLNSLKWSWNVSAIAEIPPLAIVPNFIVQHLYLRPMRFQVGGSILSGRLALQRGWAINIGGGFHHCSADVGGGFCPYADITLLIKFLMTYENTLVRKAMIVDLDAHQGNGHARDFMGKPNVFIMDIYNCDIYPRDKKAKSAIRCKVEIFSFTEDDEYLYKVESNLEKSLVEFHPDILVYNAGTDILEGDTLGRLSISSEGIIRRDEIVFMKARERRIPIVMLTSGGYQKKTARVIADSIINLFNKGLISESRAGATKP